MKIRALFFACSFMVFSAARSLPLHADGDYRSQYKNHLPTKYFIFHTNLKLTQIDEFARLSDGFVDWIDRNLFKVSYNFPIHAFVLKNRGDFKNELYSLGEQNPPDYGYFLPDYNAFFTFPDSGLGTFTHEIMHPLVRNDLKACPQWADEGIPSFFEKIFGYAGSTFVHCQALAREQGIGDNAIVLPRESVANEAP